jgi:putative FmdB family regulatory protein
MPVYEFKCEVCGKAFSKFQSMREEHKAECCNKQSRRIFTPTAFTDVYTGKYEPALRQYVGTKTERRRLMKEKNLIDYPYDD